MLRDSWLPWRRRKRAEPAKHSVAFQRGLANRRLEVGVARRPILADRLDCAFYLAPGGAGTMLMLPNGDVMMEGGGVAHTWYELTPDSTGNYADGTWTALASMSTQRLYFTSDVLSNDEVLVQGGEYSGPSGTEQHHQHG